MVSDSIGPYRIDREIGRGGMGVVYLAHDTRLDRSVALKALPADVATDPQRLERFEREARLLASVNHPNIGAIYDVVESGGRRYLALEHVEGETLAKRLSRGALPVAEALEICIQIASGVEAAHERGVIHRDLKPGNLMITQGDQVKIVDFGLAKGALGPETSQSDSPAASGSSPTITSPALSPGTMPGVILGTAPYLSPEQARGKPLDRRTDIWSWGCILFECLTGKMAFHGETVTDTLTSILHRDPDWSALPAGAPPGILPLLRRCLEKDPRRRQRDIGDARIALEEAASGISVGSAKADRGPYLRFRSRQAMIGLAGAGVLVMIGVGALGLRLGALQSERSNWYGLVNLSLPLPPDLKLLGLPRIIPDGRIVAIMAEPRSRLSGASRPQIYVRRLDGREFEPIPGTEGVVAFAMSPDSKAICFMAPASEFSAKRRFYQTSLEGGTPPTPIADVPTDAFGFTWPEQQSLFVSTASGKEYIRISVPDGVPSKHHAVEIPGSDATVGVSNGSNLPGGRGVFFIAPTYEQGAFRSGIGVLDLRTGKAKKLLSDGAAPRYVPGYLLFTRGSTLYAAPFDVDRLAIMGDPFVVMGGLREFLDVGHESRLSGFSAAAEAGTIVYALGGKSGERSLIAVDRSGAVGEWSTERRPFIQLKLSPDGTRVALVCINESGLDEIWISSRSQPTPRQLIAISGQDCDYPVWSPDGAQIAYRRISRSSDNGIYASPSSGEGPARRVCAFPKSGAELVPASWSPDGSQLLCVMNSLGKSELVLVSVNPPGGPLSQPRPLLGGGFTYWDAAFSPNGSWIAYVSNESGATPEVFVREFHLDGTLGSPLQISSGGAGHVSWSRDGKQIFYITRSGNVMASTVRPGSNLAVTKSVPLWDLDSIHALWLGDPLPDGRWITIKVGEGERETTQLEVTINVLDELNARARQARR